MSRVFVHGTGAVTPAGWGIAALLDAVEKNMPLPTAALARPGWAKPFQVRPVPQPAQRPAFLAHPRLRRASALTQHAVAASVEALGEDIGEVQGGRLRLGIIVCLMPGCVAYSRRFYEEVLNDPATASPLIFPETVFNAPASHLAAFLNSTAASYTLVGDDSAFVQGLAVGAGWLSGCDMDGCLVIGAEELDWIVADAMRLFQRNTIQTAGAGAVYLRKERPAAVAVELELITDAHSFNSGASRDGAAQAMRAQLPACGTRELLCLGTQGLPRTDKHELAAWADWQGERLAPKLLLGEAFTTSAAWQMVLACDALKQNRFNAANVSVVGANQQAIGARFVRIE
jgi:3-oxoacyl-[acyl-carrier-protein] synthase II